MVPVTDNVQIQGLLSGIRGWKGDWRRFFTAQEQNESRAAEIAAVEQFTPTVVSGVKKDIIRKVEIEYDPVVYAHMNRKPDIDISDIGYVIRQIASDKDNAVNLDTFTEMWYFSDFVSEYQKGAGEIRLLKYYSAVHGKEFTNLLQVPELIISKKQLNNAGCFTYGKNHTYAWTINSRNSILETLRHIHFLKSNGVVYYDDFEKRYWYIKEQPQCTGEIVKSIMDKHGCISLTEYNNGVKRLVTPRQAA